MSPRNLTMSDLAKAVPDARLHGDGDHPVARCVHPRQARESTDLIFAFAEGVLAAVPEEVKPAAIVVPALEEALPSLEERFAAALVVGRPRFAQAMISPLLPRGTRPAPRIHPTAILEGTPEIGEDCHIGPHAFVGDGARIGARSIVHHGAYVGEGAVVGDDGIVHAGVRIGDGVQVGARVIVQPNAVIGGDGFAFETENAGNIEASRNGSQQLEAEAQRLHRIESWGTVIIGDDVEIGAGTTIDRAVVGATRVGEGTKIDNLVQIGHNTVIGRHCVVCAQVGIAGSCKIGDGVVLAGKVGVADHLAIGDNVVLMAKSGVTRSLESGQVYSGMPAQPVRNTLKNYAYINQLGEMRRQIAKLSKEKAPS